MNQQMKPEQTTAAKDILAGIGLVLTFLFLIALFLY